MVNRILHLIGKDKETMMRLDFVFLCDYVDFTDHGLFNAYGAGINAFHYRKLPDGRTITLVMAIEYDPAENSGTHTIEIRIIDPDGRNRIKPSVTNVDFLGTTSFYAFDTKLFPTFDKCGSHSVEVTFDGDNIASLPLDIVRGK